jgi:chemotaxis methyl-accepting protein methylase
MQDQESAEFRLRHISAQGKRAALRHAPAVRRPFAGELSDTPPHPFASWVFEQTGLGIEHYRTEPLQRRLAACLRAFRVPSVERARELILDRPELLQTALNSMLPGVSGFFRDAAVFDELRGILPRIFARRGRLRAWSAACAEGQELYSVAMLLADAGILSGSELLGSDCRIDAVREAGTGRYAPPALQDMDPGFRKRYWAEHDGHWHISPKIRMHARWKRSDILAGIEPGPWDIILWRNHAIYLKPESAATIWRSLYGALRPGGILVVGKADRPACPLPLSQLSSCIFATTEQT